MSLSFTGPYDQTGDRLDELMGWLLRAGHPYGGRPFCIYYDDPSKVEPDKLRAEACLPIDERCEGDYRVSRKRIAGAEFACAVHEGPYGELSKVYEELFAWIQAQGYQFVEGAGTREVFLRLAGETAPDELPLTEVQVPVQKA
jgi:effector-binding domain-containing protein